MSIAIENEVQALKARISAMEEQLRLITAELVANRQAASRVLSLPNKDRNGQVDRR